MSGRGEALREVGSATTPFGAVGGRVARQWWLSERTGIQAHLGVRAPLTRNRFLVDQMPVWSSASAEVWLGLSAIAQFP